MCVIQYGCGKTSDRKGRIYIYICILRTSENRLLELVFVPEANSDRTLKGNV